MNPSTSQSEAPLAEHVASWKQDASFGEATYQDPNAGQGSCPRNISQTEQWVSLGLGTALATAGLLRGKLGGLALLGIGGSLIYRGVTGHCQGYQLLGINTAEQNEATAVPAKQGCQVDCSVTIARPAAELYSFWREVENLPKIMRHLKEVEAIDHDRSKWTATGPMDIALSWEAEIINDVEKELIAWRSLPDSQVDSAGSVRFEQLDNNRGTSVHVNLRYNPPGGKAVGKLASFFGLGLDSQIKEDLRRFKSTMEAGEVPTVEGQPHGT